MSSEPTDPLPDEHVFRLAGNIVVEWPDVPIPAGVQGDRRLSTVWLEPLNKSGWAEATWEPCDRGWYLPAHLTEGAVVEFDSWWYPNDPTPGRTTWYGWVRSILPGGLVVIGPYRAARAAVEDGEAVAERRRCEVLEQFRSPQPDCIADE